ncbi:DUF3618 domain-containing protein [Mycobacterium sp. URHB0021]|jgi:uncharacterized protein DUF3618
MSDTDPAAVTPPDGATADSPPPSLDQQREELAETVDALRAKLDVPTRIKAAVQEQAQRLNDNTALRNGLLIAVLAATTLVIVRRYRARRRR